MKAIAPWEACSDLYREQFVRGGTFDSGLFDWIIQRMIRGRGRVEDFHEMYRRSRVMNAYWADKRVDFSRIDIPTFITASYASFVHTMGSIRGFMELPESVPKWLKINPWQEWYDLWACPESSDELAAFFDHYLKDIDNGFVKDTPRVRTTVLQYGLEDPLYNIPENEYPLARTVYRELHLGAEQSLNFEPVSASSFVEHESTGTATSVFNYKFDRATRLVGLPKAILYMSCPGSDDMTVYVSIRKLDVNGRAMVALNIPWSRAQAKSFEETDPKDHSNLLFSTGFMGILRASHREVDEKRSMHPQYPYHPHSKEAKVGPDEIVKMEIGIWAMGADYQAGESIQLQVSGSYPLLQEFEGVDHEEKQDGNRGKHVVHFGGDYPSRLILPFV